jgi:hypothetical protein
VAEEEPIVIRWLLSLAILLGAIPADAQPAAPDRHEKIKQRIRALRAYTLTEELALDEKTAAKLFPALAKFDEEFDKLLVARQGIQRRLNEAHTMADARAVDRLIDEAVANQRALWDTEDRRLAQLRKILTPAQTARVLVVLPAMERKIQNQLRRAVQRQQRGPQRGRPVDPFAPDTDTDDEAPPPRKPARARP